jgi:hypothetical protein
MLGSRAVAPGEDPTYASWFAAATEAMNADAAITISIVMFTGKFIGLKVTYDPSVAAPQGSQLADLGGRVVLDLSYDDLALELHPTPSVAPTFSVTGKLVLEDDL